MRSGTPACCQNHTMNFRHLALGAALLATLLPAAGNPGNPGSPGSPATTANPAKTPDQPYTVEVWSDATFGPDGRLQQLEVVKTPELPEAFVERVRSQLTQARIPPVKDDSGAAATFQTGVWTGYLVTPAENGATVRLQGMRVEPRPLKRYAASRPAGLPANTPLQARVQCAITAEGRCGEAKVLESSGTFEALRRWALASARGWEFKPQRINGQPVGGIGELTLDLTIDDLKPADFRDPRKL